MDIREESFWENHYELELRNLVEHGDEGEIWFGAGISRKIASWIISKIDETKDSSSHIEIVDVGCGNAFTICEIAKKLSEKEIDGFKITGIDFSMNSIKLGEKIVESRNLSRHISLHQCDFLNSGQLDEVTKGIRFDFILDKGTYDAICLLAPDTEQSLEQVRLAYMKSVYSISKVGTIFVMASCNNTKEEIMHLMQTECNLPFKSKLVTEIESSKIQFGGKQGNRVTCLIFEIHS